MVDYQRYKVVEIPGGEVRVYAAQPFTDDASDMYVLDVLGVTVTIRRRGPDALIGPPPEDDDGPDTYVHIDSDGTTDDLIGPLRWEVRNGGESGGE